MGFSRLRYLVSCWHIAVNCDLYVYGRAAGNCRYFLFSIVLVIWLFPLLAAPLKFMEPRNLLPVFEANMSEILKGIKSMTFTIIGFEIIYVIYPFVKDKENAKNIFILVCS